MTVLVDGMDTDLTGSGSTCGHSNTGNLCMRGNPVLRPGLKDLAFVVDRDIDFSGNAGSEVAGLVTAGEQTTVTGSVAIEGALVAQDRADTDGSIIHKNLISGNLTLTFDANLDAPVSSLVRVTAWNEL